MLLPTETTVSTVRKWLKTGGVSNVEIDSDWINVRTTVGVANELLSAKFAWYTSEAFGKRLRTVEYSVPDEVASEVLTIQPTVRFGQGIPEHATHHVIDDSEIIALSAAAANTTDCVCITHASRPTTLTFPEQTHHPAMPAVSVPDQLQGRC